MRERRYHQPNESDPDYINYLLVERLPNLYCLHCQKAWKEAMTKTPVGREFVQGLARPAYGYFRLGYMNA